MNIIEEYLVKIGALTDTRSFSQATGAVNQLTGALGKLKSMITFGGIAAAMVGLTKAIADNIKSVADADLEYQKLASRMWVTKETAKALSMVVKTMGASEQDIAWVPELREQFFRLRQEMNALATPVDSEKQLRWIRDIGYDVQSLQLKLKMLQEWVVYFLIKYLQPYIKQFQEFIRWLNDKLGNNMPKIAETIASWLERAMRLIMSLFRVIKNGVEWVWDAFESLPTKVRALVPVFAAVGALIMASPFGMMLTAIGASLILLEDFFGYLDGKESSATLAPMWKWLKEFSEGTGSNFLRSITGALGEVYKALEKIFTGIDYDGIFAEWNKSLKSIGDGLDHLLDSLGKLLKKFDSGTPTAKSFFDNLGKYIGLALRTFGRLAGSIGAVMESLARAIDGDFKGAAKVLGTYMKDLVTGTFSDIKGTFFNSGSGGSLDKARQIVAEQPGEFLGNANGCTFFVQGALGEDDEFIKSLDGNLYVPDWVTEAKKQGRYTSGTEGMQAGDIIVYDYGQAGGFGDHVVLSDGNGGAYGNSTSQRKPMYYEDASVIGNIAGYIRPGAMNGGFGGSFGPESYAASGIDYASVSGYAAVSGAQTSNVYNGGGLSVGAINIYASGDPKAIADAVGTKLRDLNVVLQAHQAGGRLST